MSGKDKPMSAKEALKRVEDAREFLALGQRSSEPYLGPALEIALSALREKAAQENPEPLPLEQLRGMDGEPVWCRDIYDADDSRWGILSTTTNDFGDERLIVRFAYGDELLTKGMVGTLYAHKPGGEVHHDAD